MNILMIAGTFDENDGKKSSVANSMYKTIVDKAVIAKTKETTTCTLINGGNFENQLKTVFDPNSPTYIANFDIIFWFANVPNNFEKYRDIKSINPKAMLITSKRNDNEKYPFGELIQRSLALKANLTVEFSKNEYGKFNLKVFDPLGCVWADTTDIETATSALFDRLIFIRSVTRQTTVKAPEDKLTVMNEYFPAKSDKTPDYPTEIANQFIDIVKNYAMDFQKYMPTVKTERFVGNTSFRCSKGMPSFRYKDYIFVSKRNVDKQFIELNNFVPVYMENDTLYYCGDEKPSVDTPVQMRLYKALPNINYMLHAHCYLKNASFTAKAIPCGAIEEVDAVLECIKNTSKKTQDFYKINLLGHGSLVLASDLKYFDHLEYTKRPSPEEMYR